MWTNKLRRWRGKSECENKRESWLVGTNKKKLLTIQLISTDSRDPFDFFVAIHRSNCVEEISLSRLFSLFFFSSHTPTLELSVVLDSFPLLLLLWLPFVEFISVVSSSFKKYRNFNATKYVLNLLGRKQKAKMSLYSSVRQTFCRIVSEKEWKKNLSKWNSLRFSHFSSWMIKVIRHTIYFFSSLEKTTKNDFFGTVFLWCIWRLYTFSTLI